MSRKIGTRTIPWLSDQDPKRQQFFEEVKHRLDSPTSAPTSPSGGTPTLIEFGMTFTVGKNTQVLFTEEIDLGQDAEIECDENGILTEVN